MTDFAFPVLQSASLLIIAFGIFYLILIYRRSETRSRLEKAQQFILRWNDPDFLRISSFVFDQERIERIRSIGVDLEDSDKREFQYVITMLNYFEEMALSIEYGIADERLLRKYFAQSALEIYHSLGPVIIHLRKQRNNKAIFITFERLIGKWSFKPRDDS